MNLLDQLDLFHGQLSQNRALIYARLPQPPELSDEARTDCELIGTIHGPHSARARTLPATIRFQDGGPGASWLARATLPDPCCWSPDTPHLYRVAVSLRRKSSGETLATATHEFGLRPLATHGASLFWEAKRWVLRGVSEDAADAVAMDVWRETQTALIVREPREELCTAASRQGALIVVRTSSRGERLVEELRRWAKFAAVGMVVVEAAEYAHDELKTTAPNLVIARAHRLADGVELPHDVAPGELLWCDIREATPTQLARLRDCSAPLVIERRVSHTQALDAARAECDRLQRDMVPYGDFAGYVV